MSEDPRIQSIIDNHSYYYKGRSGVAGISDDLGPSLITNENSEYDDDLYGPSIQYAKQNRDYKDKTGRWFQRWKGQWISLVDVTRGNDRRLIRCRPVRYDGYHIILQF
jgi:hypothetical protein